MEDHEISIFPEQPIVYGTFWQRVGAALIDGVIMYIPGIFITMVFGDQNVYLQWLRHESITSASMLSLLISTVMYWLYFALLESGPAQATVGKMALGMKVTDVYGERISFARATGRHFAKSLSALIIFIGYLMMLWNYRNQTLHDQLAGTLVVKIPQANQ